MSQGSTAILAGTNLGHEFVFGHCNYHVRGVSQNSMSEQGARLRPSKSW
jgi:hypothetical protein